MSAKRAPAAPPQIDGYTYVQLLGSGGFSDVYLYEQQRPRRRVAVKVLLHDLVGSDARSRFDHEANLMAQLSTHPSIVTIYEADVATDGRPYLAMEYCSRPSLGATYRRDRLSVAEALRIGIQVAGAVETAHRAGILHRDIKPANILVTEYKRPALTDFGISATTEAGAAEAEGMSIPWSPPESFAEPPRSSIGTDVWALGATIYTLLAGRSPFEVPGGRNGGADLISRIERSPVPPTGRTDVPASLERALAMSMAKDPAARYPSVLALARAWQQVQVELSHATTPVDVLDDAAPIASDEDDDEPGTRVRRIVSIDPTGSTATRPGGAGTTDATTPGVTLPGSTTPLRPAAVGDLDAPPDARTARRRSDAVADDEDHTVLRGQDARLAALPSSVASGPAVPSFTIDDIDETVLRQRAEAAPQDAEPEALVAPTGRRAWLARAGVGLLVLGLAVVAVQLIGGGGGTPDPPAEPTPTVKPVDPLAGLVAAPENLVGTVKGTTATFTWSNPAPVTGDTYLWRTLDLIEKVDYVAAPQARAAAPVAKGEKVCIEVLVRRSTGKTSLPTKACTS